MDPYVMVRRSDGALMSISIGDTQVKGLQPLASAVAKESDRYRKPSVYRPMLVMFKDRESVARFWRNKHRHTERLSMTLRDDGSEKDNFVTKSLNYSDRAEIGLCLSVESGAAKENEKAPSPWAPPAWDPAPLDELDDEKLFRFTVMSYGAYLYLTDWDWCEGKDTHVKIQGLVINPLNGVDEYRDLLESYDYRAELQQMFDRS